MDQNLRDALAAIISNSAIEEAYEVAEAGGWRELFPGVIYNYKKEERMQVSTAKSIIVQAKKDETYAGPVPEDDETCITEAEQLVDMAKQAWEQYIRGPEVETILKLAASENGGDPEETQEDDPAEEEIQAKEAPENDPEPDDDSGDEEETGPKPDLEGINPELTKVEPWQGYNEDRVKDITEGINVAIQEEDDARELISHIWAFESAHKNRVRILKHASEAFKRLNGETPGEDQEAEVPEESGGSPEAEGEGEVSDISGDSGSDEVVSETATEEESSSDGDGAEKAADAKPDAKSEVGEQGKQGGNGKDAAKAPGQNPYSALVTGVDRQLANERLDVPKPPEEKAPELPWKWGDISDGELRDFHMQFASLAYYKGYLQTRDDRIAMHCKEAADELHNQLLLKAPRYDEKGKEIRVTLLEAQIESDPNVKKWRRLQRKHESFAIAAKREMESYYKLVEALSRLESMRHNSWERARK